MRLTATDGWWGDSSPDLPREIEPAGYAWMVRTRSLDVMPHDRWSFIGRIGGRQSHVFQGVVWEVFSASYGPADVADQLEFALKYDGVNLEILRAWFETLTVDEIEALEQWVRRAPNSTYARRSWYLYELLTGRTLGVDDVETGAYTPLLDADDYFVGDERRIRRQRVIDNLMGDRDLCPMVRRTPALQAFSSRGLGARISEILGTHDAETLARATNYLYTKETKSSFEIERDKPSQDRVARFVAVLRQVHDWPALTKEHLVRLQNLIVSDSRSRDSDYRQAQNYVSDGREPEFVSPRPGDLGDLMAAWFQSLTRMVGGPVDPVVAAAAAAFLFVYLHPFEDGNGRIHRFLIHYVLAQKGFTPRDALVPVSATMLANLRQYDEALERFSKPLMARLRYEMDREGYVEVLHDSAHYYRYPDLTAQAEAMYGWVAATIETELPKELTFMLVYREARSRLAAIMELPDRKADQFVARCIDGKGRLSKNRRRREFDDYTDEELAEMEDAVRDAMRAHGQEPAP